MQEITPSNESAVKIADIPQSINEQISTLENYVRQLPQIDLGTKNLIHGRMCARTIFIPKDTILTGTQTNIDNICIVIGDITVTTTDGAKHLTGFNVIPANAGFKRAGIAHADTYWTTIHVTELTELAEIEKEMTPEWNHLQYKTSVSIEEGK